MTASPDTTSQPAGEDLDRLPDGSLLLDDQICFALYAASRAVVGLYRPMLDDLGVTYPQYLVLLVLWERRQATIKEVGALLHLDYGTLTPLLKRLEANGFVERRRRVDDERSVDVVLTDEGAALQERPRPSRRSSSRPSACTSPSSPRCASSCAPSATGSPSPPDPLTARRTASPSGPTAAAP